MRRLTSAALLAGVVVLSPAAALARPGTGARETVDITFSTTAPGSPAGFTYSASFRNPSGGAPPALRRLVITSPAGADVDTSAVARCTATDAELKQRGDAACPAASRIGVGTADVKPVLFPTVNYSTTISTPTGSRWSS